jgi:hypothetical protein
MEEANEETIQLLFAPSSGSRPSTSAELLERIDIDDLMLELDTDRLLRSAVPCVVDTEFFYSAFQSQLKHGGAPRSLQPAREGEVRLFMAEETFEELVEKKLPKFATQLGTTTAVLENFLGRCWLDWLNLVELPTESVDARVAAVVARDSSDRPAACLASLLAPCVLLTNDQDFEALVGAIQSLRNVVVIRAAAALGRATLQLQTMAILPTLPVTGAAKGTRWVANRIGVSPWILGGIIVLLVVWAYRRQDGETRAVIDSRLLSLQASRPEGLDVEVATILLGAKLRGQASIVKSVLGRPDLAETILGLAKGLDAAGDVTEARQIEASAAACYFDAWCEHPATTLRFTTADAGRVPAHWLVFNGRRSLLTKGTSNRKAERPLNPKMLDTYLSPLLPREWPLTARQL